MKRILLKLSGEMLLGNNPMGIDPLALKNTAANLIKVKNEGYELAIVIGGGNIFRGLHLADNGLNRTQADHMGMLATLINGVALKAELEKQGVKTTLFSALECPRVAESYQYDKVIDSLEKGDLIVFVGGTGNPLFTTDTAAALRASEIGADLLVKATKVDGVYDRDPKKGGAKMFETLSYADYLSKKLAVMDLTAITLCMNNKVPVFVMNMKELGTHELKNLITHKKGTIINHGNDS
ncbi:MAG: UMP kinase [Parachlamydiaceae bacterium]